MINGQDLDYQRAGAIQRMGSPEVEFGSRVSPCAALRCRRSVIFVECQSTNTKNAATTTMVRPPREWVRFIFRRGPRFWLIAFYWVTFDRSHSESPCIHVESGLSFAGKPVTILAWPTSISSATCIGSRASVPRIAFAASSETRGPSSSHSNSLEKNGLRHLRVRLPQPLRQADPACPRSLVRRQAGLSPSISVGSSARDVPA